MVRAPTRAQCGPQGAHHREHTTGRRSHAGSNLGRGDPPPTPVPKLKSPLFELTKPIKMAILDAFVMIFGKIPVETPKYETIKATEEYEIRNYPPRVVAAVTYDRSEVKDKDGYGFEILANYIGAFGNPKNVKNAAPEPIAMTSPVITKEPSPIAMTAPVVTKEGEGETTMTMAFMLPEKYRSAEEAPKPLDERVQVREQVEIKYGVVKFSGLVRSLKDKAVAEKAEKLRKCLERDGYRVIGDPILARYNPPWTLPFFRTNEVFMPVA